MFSAVLNSSAETPRTSSTVFPLTLLRAGSTEERPLLHQTIFPSWRQIRTGDSSLSRLSKTARLRISRSSPEIVDAFFPLEMRKTASVTAA